MVRNVFKGKARIVVQAGRISGGIRIGVSPWWRAAVVLAVLLALSSAAGSAIETNPPANPTFVAAGKLTVCTDRFDPRGIDFDLIDLVATRLGVTRQVVKAGIEDGSALSAGRCDITSGMVISASRMAVMDLSFGYFFDRLGLLVKNGAAIRKLDQFTKTNVTLGVQRGARGEHEASKRALSPTLFGDEDTLFRALLGEQVDAVLHDLIAVNHRRPSGFERSDEIDLDIWYGLAVRKGNAELLNVVNATIDDAVRDGIWANRYRFWVGSEPSTAVPIR
jgi:polar amino acid transport system substrate-binding protein